MMPQVLIRTALAVVFIGCTVAPALANPLPTPQPSWEAADWQAFSQNLVTALASDNEGVKLSALQLVVHYGDRLDVRAAQFEVAKLFRSHQDQRVRRLAAVACSRMKSPWAMGFLRLSEPFERDAQVRATIRSLTSTPS